MKNIDGCLPYWAQLVGALLDVREGESLVLLGVPSTLSGGCDALIRAAIDKGGTVILIPVEGSGLYTRGHRGAWAKEEPSVKLLPLKDDVEHFYGDFQNLTGTRRRKVLCLCPPLSVSPRAKRLMGERLMEKLLMDVLEILDSSLLEEAKHWPQTLAFAAIATALAGKTGRAVTLLNNRDFNSSVVANCRRALCRKGWVDAAIPFTADGLSLLSAQNDFLLLTHQPLDGDKVKAPLILKPFAYAPPRSSEAGLELDFAEEQVASITNAVMSECGSCWGKGDARQCNGSAADMPKLEYMILPVMDVDLKAEDASDKPARRVLPRSRKCVEFGYSQHNLDDFCEWVRPTKMCLRACNYRLSWDVLEQSLGRDQDNAPFVELSELLEDSFMGRTVAYYESRGARRVPAAAAESEDSQSIARVVTIADFGECEGSDRLNGLKPASPQNTVFMYIDASDMALRKGDIVLPRVGRTDLVYVVGESDVALLPAENLIVLRPSAEKTAPDYLFTFLSCSLGRRALAGIGRGSRANMISLKDLLRIKMPNLLRSEQADYVDRYRKADALCRGLRAQLKQAEEMRDDVFNETNGGIAAACPSSLFADASAYAL